MQTQFGIWDLVPDATSEEIDSALSTACGNVDLAAQNLLGFTVPLFDFSNHVKFYNVHICFLGLNNDRGDFYLENNENKSREVLPIENDNNTTAQLASPLEKFRKDIANENFPRQKFVVSRGDGTEELKKTFWEVVRIRKSR